MTESSLCVCGHASDWHSHGGHGDCEHDRDCGCASFLSWAEHGKETSLLLSCIWHADFLGELSVAWKERVGCALYERERLLRASNTAPKPKPDGGAIHA